MSSENNPMEDVVSPKESWGMDTWYDPANETDFEFESITLSAGSSLAELQQEFVFFTPALLYLYGGFNNNMLQDFVNQHKVSRWYKPNFFAYQAKHPIFRGLEAGPDKDPAWNYSLFATPTAHWIAFRSFMLSLAFTRFTETTKRVLIRVGMQDVEIADPIELDRTSVLPAEPTIVTIHGFGVNGSEGAVAFEAGKHPIMAPPKIAFHEPQEDHLVYTQAFFAGKNPHDAVAKWRTEKDGNQNRPTE